VRKVKKQRQEKKDGFKETARRLECDEDKGRFEAKLGKIAKVRLPEKAKAR
jgi:hypothetical protein